MPDGKKAPGEEREIRTRGMGARIYADDNAEMRLRIFRALFFLAKYFLFSLSRHKFKKKTEIVYSSCFFFFYKEVYLLIVIF